MILKISPQAKKFLLRFSLFLQFKAQALNYKCVVLYFDVNGNFCAFRHNSNYAIHSLTTSLNTKCYCKSNNNVFGGNLSGHDFFSQNGLLCAK